MILMNENIPQAFYLAYLWLLFWYL